MNHLQWQKYVEEENQFFALHNAELCPLCKCSIVGRDSQIPKLYRYMSAELKNFITTSHINQVRLISRSEVFH